VILETPELGALDESEELGVGVCNEAKVIDEKKNADKESEEGGEDWNGEVGESLLEGPNKIGDVESPKEGGEVVTFGEALDNVNEGGRRDEPMMDSILQVGMKSSKVLPKWGWNLEVTQAQEEKFSKN